MPELFIHVGYPKTATTTFQKHVFPQHEEIDYLGKFIPSFQYRDEKLFPEIDKLMTTESSQYTSSQELREIVDRYRQQSTKKIMLISSESFIHVTAIDLGVVAQRIKEAFNPCKIVITIREQCDLIKSFFGLHGRFGQYLFLCKEEGEQIRIPLSMEEWLTYSFRAYHKNFLSILHYNEIINYYCELFGRENVGVFLFEEFVRDKPTYIRNLCAFLGIDWDRTLRLVENKHENPNLSKGEFFYYRVMSKLLKQFHFDIATMNRSNWRFGSIGGSQKAENHISAFWMDKLRILYKDGNRELMKGFGLQLDSFNYLL